MKTVELNPGQDVVSAPQTFWQAGISKLTAHNPLTCVWSFPATIVELFWRRGEVNGVPCRSELNRPALARWHRNWLDSRPRDLPWRWQTTALGCCRLKDEGLEVAARRRNTPHRFARTSGENFYLPVLFKSRYKPGKWPLAPCTQVPWEPKCWGNGVRGE